MHQSIFATINLPKRYFYVYILGTLSIFWILQGSLIDHLDPIINKCISFLKSLITIV